VLRRTPCLIRVEGARTSFLLIDLSTETGIHPIPCCPRVPPTVNGSIHRHRVNCTIVLADLIRYPDRGHGDRMCPGFPPSACRDRDSTAVPRLLLRSLPTRPAASSTSASRRDARGSQPAFAIARRVIRRHDGGHLCERGPTQTPGRQGQPATLLIRESEPLLTVEFPRDPVLPRQ
jgi:hypothetical protein